MQTVDEGNNAADYCMRAQWECSMAIRSSVLRDCKFHNADNTGLNLGVNSANEIFILCNCEIGCELYDNNSSEWIRRTEATGQKQDCQ